MTIHGRQFEHKVQRLFILFVFALFAASLLMILLLGAKDYKIISQKNSLTDDRSVCIQYIAAKIRHNDRADCISVSQFSNAVEQNGDGSKPYIPSPSAISTLNIKQEINGQEYETRIYLYDGYVRELFCESGTDLDPSAGSTLMPGRALKFNFSNDIIHILFTDVDDQEMSVDLTLRSGGVIPG